MTKMLANKVAFILFDGYNSLDHTTEIEIKSEASTEDVTVLSSSWIAKRAATKDMSIAQKGFLDDVAGGIWAQIIAKAEGSAAPFAIGFEGNTLGVRCVFSGEVFLNDFSRQAVKQEIEKYELTYNVTDIYNAFADGLIQYPLGTTPGGNGSQASYLDAGAAPESRAITSSAISNPGRLLIASHTFKVGDYVVIAGHTGSTPSINGTWQICGVPDATHIDIPVNITTGGTGGTATYASGGIFTVHMNAITSNPTQVVWTLTDCDTSGGSYVDVTGGVITISGSPVPAPKAGYAVVAPGTVIRRYTKLKWAWTGGTTPTATVLAALKRN